MSREASQATWCLSNLKQLAAVAVIYAEDNGGKLWPIEDYSKPIAEYWRPDGGDLTTCPASKAAYSCNSVVLSKTLDLLEPSEDLIVFYEGRNRELAYIHD